MPAWIHMLPLLIFAPHHASDLWCAYFTITPAYALGPALPSTGSYYPSVSVLHSCRWYRNINLFSIAYDIRPRLRPDLPWADEPSPGNLGLSTCKFLACISLLIPAFSLLYRPRLLPLTLLPIHDAPLPLTGIYTALSFFRITASF